MTINSPQALTAYFLLDAGLVYLSADAAKGAGRFAAFVDIFPDAPDSLVSVSSNGVDNDDGRVMDSGERIVHPGVQIRVRAKDPTVAYAKAEEIWLALNAVVRETLLASEINGLTGDYRIDNFSTKSRPRFVGVGKDDQRPSYVFDLTVTYRKLT